MINKNTAHFTFSLSFHTLIEEVICLCGICYKSSFFNPTDKNEFIKACDLLNHRGPDDEGYLFTKNHSFGHKRLAIREVLKARQPMSLLNCHLVYNGELYNGEELEEKLHQLGESLEFASDTLLLLKLLMGFDTTILKELNGIFSFVYTKDDRVLIVRDMFGVKPLFYTMIGQDIMVSSEIKSLLSYRKQAVVDREGLCELLGMGPSHSEGKTIYKGIYEVKPGHYLTFDQENGLKDHCYYQLTARPFHLSYDETVQEVRRLLDRSIKRQMISDVGVSCFLSGGLDSSIISTIVAKNKDHLDTYSIDYEDNRKDFVPNQFEVTSDRDFTKKVSEAIGSNQHDILIDNQTLVDGLKQAVLFKDAPGMTDIDSSMYYLAQQIAKTHKVSLSGECADEIFGGYPWFYKKEKRMTSFPWIRNLDDRENFLQPKWKEKLHLKEYVQQEYTKALNETPVLPTDTKTTVRQRQLSYINMRYFMTNLLDRKDRMTMGASLEVRVPFCDKDLVDFLYNVPFQYKYRSKVEKKLLRDAYEGTVIKEVVDRKKSPYPKSNSKKYHQMVVGLLEEVLKNQDSILYRLFDITKIRHLMDTDQELSVPWYGQLMRKTAFLAYLYQIDYWYRTYHIEIEGEL